ncbi:MAG: 1,4-alpha-glucan branching protein GlgB [Acidocella sp.]|nr:1,4-alpha-glucan branching protein GlgB [Acidocella sp.]
MPKEAALGALPCEEAGVAGVRFAVWAPAARGVSVVGVFNGWDGQCHPMRRREAGIWETFIPHLGPGERYMYEITGPRGVLPLKADPCARRMCLPPDKASGVAAVFPPVPRGQAAVGPMSIYEVHAPSWMRREDGGVLGWDELAARLIPYVTELGFTHIELLPVMAHPFGGSWGYQPVGMFAPMPAMGAPEDFARFVTACHAAGLGVILDWVPAHFPADADGLAVFDGTCLYEYEDPREGFHQEWGTLVYNFKRPEVRQFLIANALFWLEQYGADGLRVDAVASMLYRDYSRQPGEWIPNIHGGVENLEAVQFFQELSEALRGRCPGALLIAEESTAWPGVTRAAAAGGLGFTHKWNMGWMHDTLDYIHTPPSERGAVHERITFGLVYAFSERFVLPISHDEVVYGKGSLFGRMPGDDRQRFANLRAYLAFMWAHPGGKLLFMGCEFGQPAEWNHDAELSWQLLADARHEGVREEVRALNATLRGNPALYRLDDEPDGFAWVVSDDRERSVFAFLRLAPPESPVLVVCNFGDAQRQDYTMRVPGGEWEEIFNSDSPAFGGGFAGNAGRLRAADGVLCLTLPPLGVIYMRQAEEEDAC